MGRDFTLELQSTGVPGEFIAVYDECVTGCKYQSAIKKYRQKRNRIAIKHAFTFLECIILNFVA